MRKKLIVVSVRNNFQTNKNLLIIRRLYIKHISLAVILMIVRGVKIAFTTTPKSVKTCLYVINVEKSLKQEII